jgi:hypothetical protein
VTGWRPVVASLEGRFVSASNATFLGTTVAGDVVVYKPAAGERPLWDFPAESLAPREVLTYAMSEAMGLGVVPETALGEGPFGEGSVQRYVDIDEAFDPIRMLRDDPDALWPVALLDIVTNNADRKLGHILRTTSGSLTAIDNGLTFHVEDKLRTVLWHLEGRRMPDVLVAALEGAVAALAGPLGDEIEALPGGGARTATRRRIERLLRHPVHPPPPDDRPALPWPPY